MTFRVKRGPDGIGDLVPDPTPSWRTYLGIVRDGVGRNLTDDELHFAGQYFEFGLSTNEAIEEISLGIDRRRSYAYSNGRCIECGAVSGHTTDCAAVN